MAFPSDLEIEVAFNNDIDETDYAQSGWTSILPYVAGFSGDLRGRSYELDRAEAGSISVTLDNSDSRFIPGSVQSPYYPYVKSDRRFRIRGKNMAHPNVARGGSRDRNMTGFLDFNAIGVNGMYQGTFSAEVNAMDQVSVISANAEPNSGIGQGKEKVYDGLATTMWTINTQAGWVQYKLPTGVQVKRYKVTIPAGNPNRNIKNWTLQGSNNGSSFTTIHTVTNNTWTLDYETQEFTVTSPGFYLYYRLDITANIGAVANTQLAELVLEYDDAATDLQLINDDLTHFVKVTKPASQAPLSTYHRTIAWFVPLEYGVRLSHSAYIWKISGTEPTGLKAKFYLEYYDSNWAPVAATVIPQSEITTLPISATPTQLGFSHTPPADAKYGVVSLGIFIPGTTNSTDLIYGVTGIQSELPANLTADISGFRDQFNWAMEGNQTHVLANSGSDPTTSFLQVTWAVADVNLFQTIPHLIPGEWYTATVEARLQNSQPNVLFSGDEGLTGALINSSTFTQYTTTFEAQQAEQEVRFILQGTPSGGTIGLNIRKLRVEKGQSLSLSLPVSGTDNDFTTWLRPKDIFEGWVETWPAVAGSTEMSITVVDRMKRVGEVELANTLNESLQQDLPGLLMPLTDSLLDTPGRFSQLGYWGDFEGGPTFVDISHSRGDLSTASYTTLTDDGPTGEASFKNAPASINVGYFFAIPYSKDFTTVTPPPSTGGSKPPPTKPKPGDTPTYEYTKKWYATWSRSYEGDNSTRFDDSPYMYQGSYDSSSPGNQKSLAGFDYKNIQATLSGAEILSMTMTVKNEHARWNKGLYLEAGTHNYSSKPSTWSGGTVTERKWKKWVTEGGTVTIDMGASTGRAFRDGSEKGIAIGPEATNDHDHYGYFKGATQSSKPFITIKYRK